MLSHNVTCILTAQLQIVKLHLRQIPQLLSDSVNIGIYKLTRTFLTLSLVRTVTKTFLLHT